MSERVVRGVKREEGMRGKSMSLCWRMAEDDNVSVYMSTLLLLGNVDAMSLVSFRVGEEEEEEGGLAEAEEDETRCCKLSFTGSKCNNCETASESARWVSFL